MYMYICVFIHKYMCAIYVYTYIQRGSWNFSGFPDQHMVYVYVYIYMYIHIHIYIYIYTHVCATNIQRGS